MREQVSIAELKNKIEKLKNELYWEEHKYGSQARELAHKYLNRVFDIIEELRL